MNQCCPWRTNRFLVPNCSGSDFWVLIRHWKRIRLIRQFYFFPLSNNSFVLSPHFSSSSTNGTANEKISCSHVTHTHSDCHTTTLTHKHVVLLYTNKFIYFAVPRSTFSSVFNRENNRDRRSFFAVGRSNGLSQNCSADWRWVLECDWNASWL